MSLTCKCAILKDILQAKFAVIKVLSCSNILKSQQWKCRSSEVLCKKGVLRGFAKVIGKHLCWSLFFNEFAEPPPVVASGSYKLLLPT